MAQGRNPPYSIYTVPMDWVIPQSDCLLTLLGRQADGVSEYSLMEQLSELNQLKMPDEHGDLLGLFRAHFLLFHSLYRLRDELWQQQRGHLDIGLLTISLLPYQASSSGLTTSDPLRSYYLDLTELDQTDELHVAEMVASFWNRLANPDQRQQALEELGLHDPVDDDTIRQRYRKLAMQHHPDRGGDNSRFQLIGEAMSQLKPIKK
ncbi:MAG: DnaJ domain-containing protein [Proteobacteria bacterium]|nr:DnaJ domain-containing protein [Pseudomonadota bacterium]